MAQLTGDYNIVSTDPIYVNNTTCYEVSQENLISGNSHYLIDSNNNIISGPAHVEGTSIFEKAHDFYVKNEGVIIGVGALLIIGGVANKKVLEANKDYLSKFGEITMADKIKK